MTEPVTPTPVPPSQIPPSGMPPGMPPRAPGGPSFATMVPGLLIMAFGAWIIYDDRIIKYVFGGFLILVGMGAIVAARKVSRARARMSDLKQQFQGFGGGFPPGM